MFFKVILNAPKNVYLKYLQRDHNLSQENKRNILGWSFSIHIKRFFITKENLNGTCLYMVIDPRTLKKCKKNLGLTDILIWKNTIRYLNTNGGWTRVVIAFFLSFFSTWMEPHLNNMLLLFEMIILNSIEWKWHGKFSYFQVVS